MSWADITKKNSVIKTETKREEKEKIVVPVHNNKIMEETDEDLFDYYVGTDLLEQLCDIKYNCEKYTPWLFHRTNTNKIYNFIYNYIDVSSSLPDYLLKRKDIIDSDDDNSDNMDDNYY